MTVLLQVSDPHFGTEQPTVVDALTELARQQRPELVVLSGDITQRARPSQFRAARAFTDSLGVPVLAVPGNHDIPLFDVWTRLRSPYGRYSAAFGADLEPVHRSAELLVVCVNTTRPWRHKDGEVSALQIDRVARLVEHADPAQLRVVVVHQPSPSRVPRTSPTDCAGMRPRCGAGLKPAPTSSSAVTSTFPTSCRCKAWRARCGSCRRARPCRPACARVRPTR